MFSEYKTYIIFTAKVVPILSGAKKQTPLPSCLKPVLRPPTEISSQKILQLLNQRTRKWKNDSYKKMPREILATAILACRF